MREILEKGQQFIFRILSISFSFNKKVGYSLISIFVFFQDAANKIRTLRIVKFSPGLPSLKTVKIFVFGFIASLVFVFVPYQLITWLKNLPNPALIKASQQYQPTQILDRKGRLLYEIYIDKEYKPVKLEQIPRDVIASTIAIEDDKFFSHPGFRLDSIIRAAKSIFFENRLEGGSTITQQLVKNVLLTPERTISRKLKELVLAVWIEAKYSKEEILELYLNNIPYGGSAWGVEVASQKFFGKHVSELNLAEASLLAGLPKAPTIYSPLNGNLDMAKVRQRLVLDKMVEMNYISEEEATVAFNQPLHFVTQAEYIRAPHFVTYVRNYLEQTYGPRYTNFGGLVVTTSLDLDLQEQVQTIVSREVARSDYLNITNGAAVVLDSKTGEILAYVGSVDYFKEGWGAFDVITAFRQPGSSIKPLTYASAFKSGLTPISVIDDSPVAYPDESGVYKPVNYDGRFHGRVTLRQALANSYNIPAVKLVHKLGADNVATLGRDLGLQGWEVDGNYGLAITLGGREVRLLDLANVYATLARGGKYTSVTPIVSITDAKGYEIYTKHIVERQIIDTGVAYMLTHILSDNAARSAAFGPNSMLNIPGYQVAVKTGTSDLKKDNWTFGYTPSYTVGVWVGNNDNTPMNEYLASGLSGAAPIWNQIMVNLLEGTTAENFEVPSDVIVFKDEKCNMTEVFLRGSKIPSRLCAEPKKEDKKDKDDD